MVVSKSEYRRPQLRVLGNLRDAALPDVSPAIKAAMIALQDAALEQQVLVGD